MRRSRFDIECDALKALSVKPLSISRLMSTVNLHHKTTREVVSSLLKEGLIRSQMMKAKSGKMLKHFLINSKGLETVQKYEEIQKLMRGPE